MIDEAHSSQGGKTSLAVNRVLGEPEDEADPEDTVNEALERRMAERKLLRNASCFAFTATPKSNILETFNEQFGAFFTDADRVARRIREDIAPKVAADNACKNARQNTPHTARMAHDQALGRVMQILLKDDTQVYKQFVENESFRRAVSDMVYAITNPSL